MGVTKFCDIVHSLYMNEDKQQFECINCDYTEDASRYFNNKSED